MGHRFKWGEDMTGQEVTVRLEDGTDVQGYLMRRGEDMTGEDAEGHRKRIDLEVDDTQANMLKAAIDKGEPVYVRFPDGAEVTGHAFEHRCISGPQTEFAQGLS